MSALLCKLAKGLRVLALAESHSVREREIENMDVLSPWRERERETETETETERFNKYLPIAQK